MHPDYSRIPQITRDVAFDLTDASHGSAVGMGHLDVIPEKFRKKINFDVTYTNSITATVTNTCKMPIVMPNERRVLEVAAQTARVRNLTDLKICILQDTLHLDSFIVSEPLYQKELSTHAVDYVQPFFELQFDEQSGDLLL